MMRIKPNQRYQEREREITKEPARDREKEQ